MSKSLTERLQEKLVSQSAEIEIMTSAELKRLAMNLKRDCETVLNSTRADIQETTETLSVRLARLRRFGHWWGMALIATWLMIGIFYAWQLMRPVQPQGSTFTSKGQQYWIPPAGAEARTCIRGNYRFLCVRLPEKE